MNNKIFGGAWSVCVGGLTCMVNFMNERDPYLLFDKLVYVYLKLLYFC